MKIIDEIPFTHHFWGGADTVQIYDLPFPQSVRLRARISGGTWSTWGYLELNEEADYGEGGFGALGLLTWMISVLVWIPSGNLT